MPHNNDSWATLIANMNPWERANASFGPYCVTPRGSLRLPIETLRLPCNGQWPVDQAPGWSTMELADGRKRRLWKALQWDAVFSPNPPRLPIPFHVPTYKEKSKNSPHDGPEIDNVKDKVLDDVFCGRAFSFCGHIFLLPDWEDFIMNSFTYNLQRDVLKDIDVFVGYRGSAARYAHLLTPGVFRKHDASGKAECDRWLRRSTIAGNILKQRFFEHENKPLTEIEAIGILQHHYIIGATDLLDLSFDVNIAKWFALHQRRPGTDGNGVHCYMPKEFVAKGREEAIREASVVLTVVVRAIGSIQLDGEYAKFFSRGLKFNWWDELGNIGRPKPEVPPFNLAPLWSNYPKRQKGFGLRGMGAKDSDTFGSILTVKENLFHPKFFPDGWDDIGGAEIQINNKRFKYGEDASHLTEFLFPVIPEWFRKVCSEINLAVRDL